MIKQQAHHNSITTQNMAPHTCITKLGSFKATQ